GMSANTAFPLLGEPLSVDLVNTRLRKGGAVIDLLNTPAALDTWLQAQTHRLGFMPAASEGSWHAVCELRTHIAALFSSRRDQTQPSAAAVRQVNQALAAPGARMLLAWGEHSPRLAPPNGHSQRNALLGELAADAARVLTGPHPGRLRQCANPD